MPQSSNSKLTPSKRKRDSPQGNSKSSKKSKLNYLRHKAKYSTPSPGTPQKTMSAPSTSCKKTASLSNIDGKSPYFQQVKEKEDIEETQEEAQNEDSNTGMTSVNIGQVKENTDSVLKAQTTWPNQIIVAQAQHEAEIVKLNRLVGKLTEQVKNMSSNMSEQKQELDKAATDLKLTTETEKLVEELKGSIEHSDIDISTIKSEVKLTERKVNFLEKEVRGQKQTINLLTRANHELQKKVEEQENYSRRENIIVEGIAERPNEKIHETVNYIYTKLKMRVPPIQRAHRVGIFKKGSCRPIIVRLVCFQDKIQMYRQARNLKGTRIYIKDDFSKAILDKQEELRPYLIAARKEDRRARFVNDKIRFKGGLYGKEDIEKLGASLKKPGCKVEGRITLFSGELCPLSNLYNVKLTVDNEIYQSNEHFYQSKKCEAFGKEELAAKVRKAKTGREAMFLGREVRSTLPWLRKEGIRLMRKGAMAKFSNQEMRNYLLNTTDIIAEGTNNVFWGIGLNFSSQEAFLVEHWEGSNTMGTILMEIRDEIRDAM